MSVVKVAPVGCSIKRRDLQFLGGMMFLGGVTESEGIVKTRGLSVKGNQAFPGLFVENPSTNSLSHSSKSGQSTAHVPKSAMCW